MWCRSDARLWHVCYLFIPYKPFMWCRSDARLWHVCYSFIPYKPFMWCRSDARLRHCLFYLQPFEESFQTLAQCIPFLLPYCILMFLTAREHHRLSFTSWQTYYHKMFRSLIISCYIIPVFLMFASTFKRTHWLVPGYCLGQIPCLEISIAMTAPEPTQRR